ncbi:MAG: signal peptidase I [Caulobacteraceae bacterium]|nr:signal peptidase I [Caulobacteraceae bacterium]
MTSDAKDSPSAKGGAVNETVEIVKTVVYALLIAFVLRVLLFQPFTIPSASMEPNLFQGDYIIVTKYSYGYSRNSIPFSPNIFPGRILFHQPHRGDIVVFKLPRDGRTDYIKRLIGLPGDRIQVRQGVVYLNGQAIQRDPAPPGVEDMGYGELKPVARYNETMPDGRRYLTNSYGNDGQVDNTGVYVVPPHCYFMMGDNRDNSADSRFDPGIAPDFKGTTCPWDSSLDRYVDGQGVGFVPEENLVGRARLILVSWNANASLFKPWTWFTDAQPSRFFKILK